MHTYTQTLTPTIIEIMIFMRFLSSDFKVQALHGNQITWFSFGEIDRPKKIFHTFYQCVKSTCVVRA